MAKNVPTPSWSANVVKAVTNPLGFFVLALLIVESFLGIVLCRAQLEEPNKMICVWIAISLFALVVLIVALLVWFKPEHLTYDKDAHLVDRGKMSFGDNEKRVEAQHRFDEKVSS